MLVSFADLTGPLPSRRSPLCTDSRHTSTCYCYVREGESLSLEHRMSDTLVRERRCNTLWRGRRGTANEVSGFLSTGNSEPKVTTLGADHSLTTFPNRRLCRRWTSELFGVPSLPPRRLCLPYLRVVTPTRQNLSRPYETSNHPLHAATGLDLVAQ